MSSEFELKRSEEKLKDFRKEQEQLTHNLMRTRRDQAYDIDRVRREYVTRINAMETRQIALEKEVRDIVRKIERLENIKRQEEDEKNEEERQAREDQTRRRMR
tara:strand:- start:2523 stop:2831 length:309 start_codon:yes stop_codon:yes gene_type:complete